ncbi:MAG: alpha/beta hydrolase [Deltaproteobacteria bacterium]|nr:alpha/beta hydrolase [Deltaproteobacteria bacterium]
MPYCNLLDTRFYFEDEGQGPAMVLVHGAAQDTLSWRFTAPHLAGAFRTFAVDLPGHGKSDRAPQGVIRRTQDYAAYINAFIAYLDLGPVILVGHSMSGGNILQASLDQPGQVALAVPLDGAGMTLKQAVSYSDELMELITVNTYDYWETNFQALCAPQTPPERKKLIAVEAKRTPAEIILGDLTTYTSFDISRRVGEIAVPVGLVTGEEDWSCTVDNVRRTYGELKCPKALEVLPGVGHFPHMEAPEAFAAAVKRLVATLL